MTLVNQQHRSGHGLPPVLTQGSACRESPEGSGASLAAFLCVLSVALTASPLSGVETINWKSLEAVGVTHRSQGSCEIRAGGWKENGALDPWVLTRLIPGQKQTHFLFGFFFTR